MGTPDLEGSEANIGILKSKKSRVNILLTPEEASLPRMVSRKQGPRIIRLQLEIDWHGDSQK